MSLQTSSVFTEQSRRYVKNLNPFMIERWNPVVGGQSSSSFVPSVIRCWTRRIFNLRLWNIQEIDSSSSSWKSSASRRWWSCSFLENKRKSSEPIPTVYSLVWRSMESMFGSRRRSKKEIPVLYWWFRNNFLSPSSSRTFRMQSYWYFAGQCCYSEQLLPVNLSCRMCNQFTFHHQFGIDTWRSEFKQETDSILSACESYG